MSSIVAAVTFGSFGDIVTIVQLVSQLCDALNDVTGAPAEIEALAADLNGYMLVLTVAEDVLLRKDSHFDPRMRAAIEGGLKRCKDTLLAIQRHVDAFAVRLQPCAGRRVMLAYASAVRWKLFGARKEVAALHSRFDKQLSFIQLCLGVSQSNGQRALHDAAERNGVISEQILLLVHKRPREMDAGASVMQIYDDSNGTAYPAFVALPIHMLPTYLEPLIDLLDPDGYRLFIYGYRESLPVQQISERGWFEEQHIGQEPALSERKSIEGWYLFLRDQPPYNVSVIFRCTFFLSDSGEWHVLLGVPPSRQKDLVTRVLSDVLQGQFYDHVAAGLYAAEKQKADFIISISDSYNRIINLTRELAGWHAIKAVLNCFEGFPDTTCLMNSPLIQYLETRALRRSLHYAADREEELSEAQGISNMINLLRCTPRISEEDLVVEERRAMDWSMRSLLRYRNAARRDPATLSFRALAYRLRGTREPVWPNLGPEQV